MNHEGYKDLTADKALTDLQDIASLFGFDILIIKDRRTGREFKVENETNQQR